MQKISIRLEESAVDNIDSFALVHGMSRAASTEFFVRMGVQYTRQRSQTQGLEERLKAMQRSNYRILAYLSLLAAGDKDKFEMATESAERNIKEIFGEEHGE